MHLGQPPEGPIRQLADVVSLKLQHLQTVKPLECQTLDQPNPIPIEVPKEMKMVCSEHPLQPTYNHSYTVAAGFPRQQKKSQ